MVLESKIRRMTEYIRRRADRVRAGRPFESNRLCLRACGQDPELECIAAWRDVDLQLVTASELADENFLGERILDVLLNRPLQWPSAVLLVVAMLDEEIGRRARQFERQLFLRQPATDFLVK